MPRDEWKPYVAAVVPAIAGSGQQSGRRDSEASQSPASRCARKVASRCSELLEVVSVVDGATRDARQRCCGALPQEHPTRAPNRCPYIRHVPCRNVDDEEAGGRRRWAAGPLREQDCGAIGVNVPAP